MYHDIYTTISSYLTDFDIVNSLNRLEQASIGLTRREDLAKEVNEQPLEKRFIYSARIGYKDGLIKYYNVNQVNNAFVSSCGNGHLTIAQWLHGLGINIHVCYDEAFIESCGNGRLEIAQWLYSLGGINIHSCYDHAFRTSCYYGHLKIAQWLYSLGGVNIHTVNNEAFRYSCVNGHLEIAKWLYSLGNVNIHANNDQAFRSPYLKIKEWLNSLP